MPPRRHLDKVMAHSGLVANTTTVAPFHYKGLAVLPVFGAIYRDPQEEHPWFGSPEPHTAVEELYRAFDIALADDSVKAVVHLVNSPGGEANAATEYARYVYERRDQKPLMGLAMDMACSAGFLLLAPCHVVVATSPITMVGNIGVSLSMVEDDERIITYKAGKYKAVDRRRTEDTDRQFQEYVDDLYSNLVDDVANYRGLDPQVVLDTESKFMTAERATQSGLVDAVYPREVALDMFAGGTMPLFGNQPATVAELKTQNPELFAKIAEETLTTATAESLANNPAFAQLQQRADAAPDQTALAQARQEADQAASRRVAAVMALAKNPAQTTFLAKLAAEGKTPEDAALALLTEGPTAVTREPGPVPAGSAPLADQPPKTINASLKGLDDEDIAAFERATAKYKNFGGAK